MRVKERTRQNSRRAALTRGGLYPVTFYAEPDLLDRLDARAAEDDRSRAATVRRLLIASLPARNGAADRNPDRRQP